MAPKKGKPTAVTQTGDIKSIAIEAEQLIITELQKRNAATRMLIQVSSCDPGFSLV